MLRSCLAILLVLSAIPRMAGAAQSLDQQLLADIADGQLNEFDFTAACLIAGGTSHPSELADLRANRDGLQNRIVPPPYAVSAIERVRQLHARMHREIFLGQYRMDASDLGSVVRGGDFNCLSAAALYWDFMSRAGIELEIWSRPGHVYLVEPASGVTIEPASKSWDTHPPASDSQRRATPSRHITPLQLVGKFYYNRGLLLLQQGRHAEGLACIRASLRLDPGDREAQGNLLAGLNNWAAALCREERFGEASTLIDQGLAIDAGYAPLVANARYVRSHHSP